MQTISEMKLRMAIEDMQSAQAKAQQHALDILQAKARKILQEHAYLNEFIMAMGVWYFTAPPSGLVQLSYDPRGGSYHRAYLEPIATFINQYDELLGLTVTPMRFTANGRVQTSW